jgi:DNA invertase Pin-like site-specific DNA recombinase
MRVIAYVRVSTSEQAESGAGLEAERAAILAEASRRGWEHVEFIEDSRLSARSVNRRGLRLALGSLKRSEASVLVVSKMDRLSRSLGSMQRAQREGWALVALDSPADLTSPSGEAMAGVIAVFAQLERRLIGQRTREALAKKREAGVRLGGTRVISPEVRGARPHSQGGGSKRPQDWCAPGRRRLCAPERPRVATEHAAAGAHSLGTRILATLATHARASNRRCQRAWVQESGPVGQGARLTR